jgi:CubicO group peptidase (beta-lactamase class C family)
MLCAAGIVVKMLILLFYQGASNKILEMRIIVINLFVCLYFTLSVSGQVADIVASDGIKTTLQKKHIGKIFFTNKFIPAASVEETDFLQSYTLTNKSDLFFISYLENSLTNYIHQLSPGLTADSLVKAGNFQFSILIDNKLIYQSNLLPGAPYPKILNAETILNRALIDNKNGSGSWSESFWNRFMNNGGDSVLTDGKHLLKMEIRPYLKSGTLKVGKLIAEGELNLDVIRKPEINISSVSLNKPAPNSGFTISTDSFNENRIKELKANIIEAVFKKVSSIVVIKDGKLLIEEYFNGETRNTLHDPRSVGKSFSSSLIGIAIKERYIKSEDQLLKNFYDLKSFDNYSQEKENTSIKELLTMSSGFDGNDEDASSPGNEENMYPTADWVKFALDLPVIKNGSIHEWHYFTAGVILLGDILNRKVKGGLQEYADEKLFKPLNIINYKWQYTPQQVPNTAGGIQMSALDFAKYGQLYKNGGSWNKKQIIPKEWIEKSFTRQKQILGRNNEFYGYLFWNKSFNVNNKSYEAFYCAGNGGNYILIFKDLPLVVVITATAYGQSYAHKQVAQMLLDFILPAVIK